MTKRPLLVLGAVLSILIGAVLLDFVRPAFFTSESFCRTCAAERLSRDILWIPVHRVRATTLSAFLERSGVLEDHQHQWLFASGRGGWVMCALGRGQYLQLVANDAEVVEFLEALLEFHGKDAVRDHVRYLFDPETADSARVCFRCRPQEFTSREDFDRWLSEQRAMFEREVAALKNIQE